MSMMASTYKRDSGHGHGGPPPRKKVKTSELPLASATRAAIEGLAHTYKKKGTYDELKTKIWQDLENGDFEEGFSRSLLSVAEEQLEKDPQQLLRLDRNKAMLLIEGAVDRAGPYQSAEARIEKLIQAYVPEIEEAVRTIRKNDIGDEAAEKELLRGGKTDEQYAEELAKKREAREKIRAEKREKEKEIADEKRKQEKLKRREEEKRIEADQERKREARKKAELEAEEEREREREKEDKERRERRERDRARDRERDREIHRERERDRDRDRDHRDRDRDRGRDRDYDRRRRYDDDRRRDSAGIRTPATKPELSKEEIEHLEQEALDDLLKEGKKVAQRRHQLELEVDETLAPPPRKAMPASAIKPISRDTPAKTTIAKVEASSSKTPQVSDVKPAADKAKDSNHDKEGSQGAKSPEMVKDANKIKDEMKVKEETKGVEIKHEDRKDNDERSRRGSRDCDDRKRRDSRDRDRDRSDHRRRRSSRDRDDRRDKDRIRSRSRDRRRSYRSRSRDRMRDRDRDSRRTDGSVTRTNTANPDAEAFKLAAAQARAEEARKWNEERKNQPQLPSLAIRKEGAIAATTPKPKDDAARMSSPVSTKGREAYMKDSRPKSRSPTARRSSRVERSTSPINIDRYVPGATERRESMVGRSPLKKRERSRERGRGGDTERRVRDEGRERRRSRSPDDRRERDGHSRRYRSRSRERERDRKRERSRDRDRDRDRKRERSRSRDRRDRDRDRERERRRDRSRESRRDSRRV